MQNHRFFVLSLALLALTPKVHSQLSKGHQILIERGLQLQGLVQPDDGFNLNSFSNANYTSLIWAWAYTSANDSWNHMSRLGSSPGFPWARWAGDESKVPPLGGEGPYMSQLVSLQLGDEWFLDNPTVRDRAVNWFNSIRTNFPNTILYMNNYGGQVIETNLMDFAARAQPDMLCFDTYPWRSVYDETQPNKTGPAIGGPPTTWFSLLRIYRDIARGANIPFGSYNQTFAAVETWDGGRVYRHPTPSELRLNMFAALGFNAKVLIDYTYNSGASSLFNRTPEGGWPGDGLPNALYYEKADANRRAGNFGKALVRLKPIDEATSQWTTSILLIRGRDSAANLNAIPINFYAGPGGGNSNTDWVLGRNDPYLSSWSVANKGPKNNGQSGDVIVSWFKPLDESFDGTDFSNEIYMMVVNGLTDTATNSTAADCLQEITLNFGSSLLALEMLNPLTGLVEPKPLPLTNGLRQLVLNLNGGDAVLFKFADGAPFVGTQVIGAPVIAKQPSSRTNVIGTGATFSVTASGAAPFSYQWRLNGVNLSGATSSSYTLSNVQLGDTGKSYTVVVTNASGSVTSAPPATLTVVSTLPPFLYEPFDYTNIGGAVSANTPANWTFGGSGANDLSVVSGNLSYPGLLASIGNSVTNGGAGLGVRRLLGTNVNSGTLYFSALFKINNLGYGTGGWTTASTPAQVGALTDTNAPSNFRLAVLVKSNSPTSYVIGVQKGGTGVTNSFYPTQYDTNDTIFMVGKYDFNQSPNRVSLWINPSSTTFASGSDPASGFISQTTGTDGFTIDRFNIRQNTAVSVPAAMQWDELRFGNSWDEVTPLAVSSSIRLINVVKLTDGSFQFGYTNSTGPNGSIYASTNLINWTLIGTATETAPGTFQFTDSTTSNHVNRFYQLRSP